MVSGRCGREVSLVSMNVISGCCSAGMQLWNDKRFSPAVNGRSFANVWFSFPISCSRPSLPFVAFSLCRSVCMFDAARLFYVTFCFSVLTHSFRHKHTLLILSCGNWLCPCKSRLGVINQAGQAC